jgi:hypothetical protein
MDRKDEASDPDFGMAVQCRSHGHGLRHALIRAGSRRSELLDSVNAVMTSVLEGSHAVRIELKENSGTNCRSPPLRRKICGLTWSYIAPNVLDGDLTIERQISFD